MQRIKLAVLWAFVLFAGVVYVLRPADALVFGSGMGLAVVTGVLASDGDYSDKVGVYWDTIRGAARYRILRNTTNASGSATDIGTTAANYFFDATAVAGQNYFYWVRAENGAANGALSDSDQGMRAFGTIASGLFTPLNPPPAPIGNEPTATKAYLGKTLFWDEQMSSTRTVSCGTCHRPSAGGSDPRTADTSISRNPGFDAAFDTGDDIFGSPGVPENNADGTYTLNPKFGFQAQVTPRRAPSYLNSGYSPNGLFWDGRATDIFRDQLTGDILLSAIASLESQTAGPPASPVEMAHGGRNWVQIAQRIDGSRPLALATNIPTALETWIGGRTYPQLFDEAFGSPDVTPSRISMAIASHERTLFSDRAPLDRSSAQIEPLTVQEQAGLDLFVSLQCNTCHDGPLLTDHLYHNIGVRPQLEDTGRDIVTSNPDDTGRFKTPTLRNVELHAPYMHNGRFATLEEVVEFYDRGGDFDAPNVDHGIIRPLNLTEQEKADLVAFMKRPLTDPRVRDELPPFDHPRLFTESGRVPMVSGTGRAGSGAFTPRIAAISPPLAGNPNFTVSVSDTVGGAAATLVIDSADPGVGMTIPATGSFARISTDTQNTGAGIGWASVSLPVPDDAAGQTFFARWYVEDAGAINGFSVSPVARFTVFNASSAEPALSITGRVTTPSGLGLRNAVVTLTPENGLPVRAFTSSFGIYNFPDIPAGSTLTVSVSSKRYRFASRTFMLNGNLTDFDFTGLE